MSPLGRRSFLAAIVGAVAACVLPERSKDLRTYDELLEGLKTAGLRDVWQPFWFWENVALNGEAGRIAICPPPLPPEMLISEIGVYVESSVSYKALTGVMKSWGMQMRSNGRDLFAGPLSLLSYGSTMPFVQSFRLQQSDNVKVELAGDGFDTERPVNLQVMFKGSVRL